MLKNLSDPKQVDYQGQAELLADALNNILETTLWTDWADEEVMQRGWAVWAEYYKLTHEPSTPEQMQARVDSAYAQLAQSIAEEKAKR